MTTCKAKSIAWPLLIICLLIYSCKRPIDKQEASSLVQRYYAQKYQLLTHGQFANNLDSFTSTTAKSLLEGKTRTFNNSFYQLGMTVLKLDNKATIDSIHTGNDSAIAFVKENLVIVFQRQGIRGTDTVQSEYGSFYKIQVEKKEGKLLISAENAMDLDPLFFQGSPVVSVKKFDTTHHLAKDNMAFDRNAAYKYALQHFNSPNDDYCNYDEKGGDCTNFASQCLHSGGWLMVDSWRANGKGCCKNILNCSYEDCYTCSWTVAHKFFEWLPKSGRVQPQSVSLNELRLGDVVQADFNSDGHIDHTMIVTDIGGSSPLVTYRSAGGGSYRRQVPVNGISGTLYCFHVNDQF